MTSVGSSDVVLMFPGQASEYPAMLERAVARWPKAVNACEHASSVLGWDVLKHYRSDTPGSLTSNEHVQIGVYLCDYLYLQALISLGVDAQWSLGLSLGEYCHLVHIGALSFEEALLLVQERGRAYDQQSGGMMLSVFPIEHWELERVVERAQEVGCIQIANINSDSQFVLSGEQQAILEAARILEAETFVVTSVINDRLAMHSPLFSFAAERFRPALQRAKWKVPHLNYLPNLLGRPLSAPRAEDFRNTLEKHLVKPVLWRDSIAYLMDSLTNPLFLEVGPKGTLTNLVRKIKAGGQSMKVDSDSPLERVVEELGHD